MRSVVTPPEKKSGSTISNLQIMDRAKALGIEVVRMAPAWRWWVKQPDGEKVNIGQTNDEVWQALERMKPKKVAKAKPLRLWMGTGQGVLKAGDKLLRGEPQDVKVYACAVSRAALVRMIHAYRGSEHPSIEYRVKAHWVSEWDAHMATVQPQAGVWVQYAAGERPRRVI